MEICRRCGQVYSAHINGIFFSCRDELNHEWVRFEHMALTYGEQKELRQIALHAALQLYQKEFATAAKITEAAEAFYAFLQPSTPNRVEIKNND